MGFENDKVMMNKRNGSCQIGSGIPGQIGNRAALHAWAESNPTIQRTVTVDGHTTKEPHVKRSILTTLQGALPKAKMHVLCATNFTMAFYKLFALKESVEKLNLTVTSGELSDLVVCLVEKYDHEVREYNLPDRDKIVEQRISSLSQADLDEVLTYVTGCNQMMKTIQDSRGWSKEKVLGMIRDERFKDLSPYAMEGEPGYTKAMLTTLASVLSAPGSFPPDSTGYERLHDSAIEGVAGLNNLSKGYRDLETAVMFGLVDGKNKSDDGYAAFLEKKNLAKQISSRKMASGPTDPNHQDCLVGLFCKKQEMEIEGINHSFLVGARSTSVSGKDLVAEVFLNYHTRLGRICSDKLIANPKEEKIKLIAQTCQTLDQLHLFTDGNIRTIYLLLNKLLMENGLLPTTLEDPNIIDCFSVDEITAKIIAGQK